MQMRMQGVIGSGVELLDGGITDLEIAVIDGVVHVFSTTGRNGGVAGYRVGENGQLELTTTVIFPPEMTLGVSDRLVIASQNGALTLLVGTGGQGGYGYALGNGGMGGFAQLDAGVLRADASQGAVYALEALILQSGETPDIFPDDYDCSALVSLKGVTIAGQDFVVGACGLKDGVTVFLVDEETGALTEIGTMGAEKGLGVDAPTDMDIVQVGGQTFVILAAAGTSSISVMQLRADGSLTPTDHVIDNGTTRFEGVQSIAVAAAGDHVFVVAGGADNGLTLFLLLPDGTLVHLQTIADTQSTSLHKVTSIEIAIDGDTLHVFAGSQNDDGITHFAIDLSELGALQVATGEAETLTGTSRDDILLAVGSGDRLLGGDGMDVLVSGTSLTEMTGGGGADMFVIRDGSGTTMILDFEKGVDRIDLSDLPMLRDLSQLTVTSLSNGARIEYRGHVIVITSADGQPLTLEDLFPAGLEGGDHYGYFPPGDDRNFGIERIGSNKPDLLTGTARDDTLAGAGRDDTLTGAGGNDWLNGGNGNDSMDGGIGDDTMIGGAGRDTMFGGDGNDSLSGGALNDRLFGGTGNDTIDGGEGDDLVVGGAGDDVLMATGGHNEFIGGQGNDLVLGAWGNDTMAGGKGDDTLDGGGGNDSLMGGVGNDLLTGGAGHDALLGGSGHDTIQGGDGNDQLIGKGGNDWLDGGLGDDHLNGGSGHDTIHGGDGSDRLFGKGANDWLHGDDGDDHLHGGPARDVLEGGNGNDAIWGDGGKDRLYGGAGDDWLSGGAGDDLIDGGAGSDVLRGGPGYDRMIGGAGADTFEFFGDHGTGVILDFDPSEGDILRLQDAIWWSEGDLTPEEVIARYGSISEDGSVVLDFTDLGGCVIILQDYDDLDALADAIEFM